MVVATAHVGVDDEVVGKVFQRKIVDTQVAFGVGLQTEVGVHLAFPIVAVHNHAPGAVVELHVAAAGGVQVENHLAVGCGNVVLQLAAVGIDTQRVERVVAAEKLGQQLGRSRQRLLGHNAFLFELLHELVVFDERMGVAADATCQPDGAFRRLLAVELVAVGQLDVLYSLEAPHEIQVPIGAAELTVGDRFQAMGLLLGYQVGDQLVFDFSQLCGRDAAFLKVLASFLQRFGAQEAAHDVGSERGLNRLLAHFSLL